MNWPEEAYPCLGICEMDPETGYCLGCGRPPDYVRREAGDATEDVAPAPPALPDQDRSPTDGSQPDKGNP